MSAPAVPKHLRIDQPDVGARTTRAFDLLRGRPVALKRADKRLQAAGLRREWLFLSRLSGRFVPEPVEFVRVDEWQAYLTSGWVEGLPLDRFVQQADAAGQAAAVLDALTGLDHLHGAGICHRDIRARNLLIVPGPGGPRARWLDLEHSVTEGSLEAAATYVAGRPPGEDRGSDAFNPQDDVESFCALLGKVLEPLPDGPAAPVLREFARRAGSVFHLDEMPHARAAWTILREMLEEARLPVPPDCSPLGVARWVPRAEVQRTWDALANAAGQGTRAVLVHGATGVGKRRFLSHAAADLAADGAAVVNLLGVAHPDARYLAADASAGARRVLLLEAGVEMRTELKQFVISTPTLIVVAGDSEGELEAAPWQAIGADVVHWRFQGMSARDWYRWIAASV